MPPITTQIFILKEQLCCCVVHFPWDKMHGHCRTAELNFVLEELKTQWKHTVWFNKTTTSLQSGSHKCHILNANFRSVHQCLCYMDTLSDLSLNILAKPSHEYYISMHADKVDWIWLKALQKFGPAVCDLHLTTVHSLKTTINLSPVLQSKQCLTWLYSQCNDLCKQCLLSQAVPWPLRAVPWPLYTCSALTFAGSALTFTGTALTFTGSALTFT